MRFPSTHRRAIPCYAPLAISHTATPDSAAALETPSSTGPRTDAGKSISSRNAVKHNLCSTRFTGTDLEQFQAILAGLVEEWEPATQTEHLLLDQMALSQWRMDRALSLELNAFNDDHLDEKLLALALRYRTTAERAFYKAVAELQRLRKNRRDEELKAAELDEKEREAAAHEALNRLCFAPIARAPQFVSQNDQPAAPATPNPAAGLAKAPYLANVTS